MIRVLFLHRDLPFHGGVANTFLDFARHRDRERVELHVASLDRPSHHMREAFDAVQVPVHHLGDDGYHQPVRELRRLTRLHGFDVVLAGSLKSYLIAKGAAAGRACRVMFRVASIPLVIAGPIKRSLYRIAAVRDTIVFNSEAVARTHGYGWHRGTSTVVYNGVSDPFVGEDARPYPRARRAEFSLPEDAIVLGYTAEFIAWKDHRTLLAAFAELAPRHPKLHLLLLGAGELLSSHEAETRRTTFHERVRFLGPRTDARQLLGLMDVYVHPARGEGFGRAIVEAMLAGLPVVAADTGSLPEIVLRGEVGVLFRKGDPADLAAQLEKVMRDGALRERLATQGRASCLERFSPQRFADSYMALIEAEVRRS
jgi:glycosyltransferase involved in cell wall biosynthesis